MTTSIYQDEYFAATPSEIFDALALKEQHAELTGASATIQPRSGSRFEALDGALVGKVIEATSPNRLVLDWRAAEWPAGVLSRVTFDIETVDDVMSVIHLTVEGVPDDFHEICSRGWGRAYWSKLEPYLQSRRRAIVDAFVEEYKNEHNWDCVDKYVAEDCKLHLPLDIPQGREGMRLNGRVMCTAFPDVHVTREFAVIERDIVVERAHAKATHKAELMGIPASNNPVTWSELHAYRVRDDQIVEIWTEADFVRILTQIGAIQMPG